eukprot:6207121-Pleurochrysis_carterae.AAC.4
MNPRRDRSVIRCDLTFAAVFSGAVRHRQSRRAGAARPRTSAVPRSSQPSRPRSSARSPEACSAAPAPPSPLRRRDAR